MGIDTLVEESPSAWVATVDGKDYLLMKPIHADFALLGAYKCDEYGNCWYKGHHAQLQRCHGHRR